MSYGIGELPAILQGAQYDATAAVDQTGSTGAVPLILQGAAQREVLNQQQAALVKSYQQGGTNMLPIVLILGGLAAFLLLGRSRGGLTA